ncbi:PepSY domain-containing protein [Enterocloster citroniae]|uniref:PepSY domain-containing protein n=1 Tax=Enterocloster citroniae TaxID=358743 RepID=UPI0022E3A420|nr:PepSY domain-containing protein [Enterocloster citroniae]
MLEVRLKKAAVFMCTAILAAGTVGAGNVAMGATWHKAQTNRKEVKGRILVSAGPDISIAYDRDGDVLEIKGIDRAGKDFLDEQDGYLGEDCKDAVKRLVRRLDEKGWFDRETASSKNSLVIKAEKGSWYPNDNFMKEIEKGVRDVVESRDIDVYVKVVGLHALNDKGYIDRETAEKMVLEQLGLTAGDLKIKEYELDDGVYEIEVVINGVAYEVDLNAVTGEIVDMDRYDDEDDDDHDDEDDDRYDDDHDDDHDDEDDDDHDDDDHNDRDDD